MPTLTPPKVAAPSTRLMKETRQREAFINKIKQMVAKPVDNINHPEPLFNQLQS